MPDGVSQTPESRFTLTLPIKATLMTTVGLILIALVFLYRDTDNMTPSFLPGYPGDASFPRVIIVFSMICAVVILLRGLLLKQSASAMGYSSSSISIHWPEFVSVPIMVLLYAVLLEPVGFEIVTVAMLMVLLVPRMLAAPGARPARAVMQAVALSVASMFVLYLALGLFLKISLPLQFLPIFIY